MGPKQRSFGVKDVMQRLRAFDAGAKEAAESDWAAYMAVLRKVNRGDAIELDIEALHKSMRLLQVSEERLQNDLKIMGELLEWEPKTFGLEEALAEHDRAHVKLEEARSALKAAQQKCVTPAGFQHSGNVLRKATVVERDALELAGQAEHRTGERCASIYNGRRVMSVLQSKRPEFFRMDGVFAVPLG